MSEISELKSLIAEMRKEQMDTNIKLARIDERLAHIPLCGQDCARKECEGLSKRMDKMEGSIGKLAFTVIGALIVYIINWFLSGR